MTGGHEPETLAVVTLAAQRCCRQREEALLGWGPPQGFLVAP